jgi:hypothetical protein
VPGCSSPPGVRERARPARSGPRSSGCVGPLAGADGLDSSPARFAIGGGLPASAGSPPPCTLMEPAHGALACMITAR